MEPILTGNLERYDCLINSWSVACSYKVSLNINISILENIFLDLIFILWFVILFYKLFVVWPRKFFER